MSEDVSTCTYCNKRFKNAHRLQIHQRNCEEYRLARQEEEVKEQVEIIRREVVQTGLSDAENLEALLRYTAEEMLSHDSRSSLYVDSYYR